MSQYARSPPRRCHPDQPLTPDVFSCRFRHARDPNELYNTLHATLQNTPALANLTSILQHLMLVTAHPIRRCVPSQPGDAGWRLARCLNSAQLRGVNPGRPTSASSIA